MTIEEIEQAIAELTFEERVVLDVRIIDRIQRERDEMERGMAEIQARWDAERRNEEA